MKKLMRAFIALFLCVYLPVVQADGLENSIQTFQSTQQKILGLKALNDLEEVSSETRPVKGGFETETRYRFPVSLEDETSANIGIVIKTLALEASDVSGPILRIGVKMMDNGFNQLFSMAAKNIDMERPEEVNLQMEELVLQVLQSGKSKMERYFEANISALESSARLMFYAAILGVIAFAIGVQTALSMTGKNARTGTMIAIVGFLLALFMGANSALSAIEIIDYHGFDFDL